MEASLQIFIAMVLYLPRLCDQRYYAKQASEAAIIFDRRQIAGAVGNTMAAEASDMSGWLLMDCRCGVPVCLSDAARTATGLP